MAITAPIFDVDIITNLATTSAERGLTEAQFKAKFDETPAAIKTYIADVLIAELDILHATFATLTGTQTLTNKTLTSPKINENVALTATATELNYVDGVTSAIQTQFGAKEDSLISFVDDTASKTLALTDAKKKLRATHAATAINYTVPPNSDVEFPIGTWIIIEMTGAAQVAVVEGAGVTINPDTKLKINGQYTSAVLTKEATDTWSWQGSVKA